MLRLLAVVAAATLAMSAPALASGGYHNGGHHNRGHHDGWRSSHSHHAQARHHRRDHASSRHHRRDHYAARHHNRRHYAAHRDYRPRGVWSHHGYPQRHHNYRWGVGARYPYDYRRHHVSDYRAYHLAPPPRGHVWVRHDDGDAYLLALATGVIVGLALDGY